MDVLMTSGEPLPLGSIWCIGRNYAAHIAELGNARPDMPVIFSKPAGAVNTGAEIVLPAFSDDVHYETELVVRLGKGGKNIAPEDAAAHIGAYAVGLDLTARDVQSKLKEKGLPWELAKGFDGSACLSRFVPASEFAGRESIAFSMTLNGRLQQEGDTAMMIWPVAELISFLSRHFSLHEGDLIFTGTPEGVGKLHAGDELVLELADVCAQFTVQG